MFLKNKNIIFKIRRSKVTDYAALMLISIEKQVGCFKYWLKTGIRPNMTKIVDQEVKDQHK